MGKFADAVQTQNEQYATQGTTPVYAPAPVVFNPVYPTSPFDQEITPEKPYGVPEDWDYKTAELGPNNQPLPTGAIGWTPAGDPWYGDGLMGWWNGFWNRLVHPEKDTLPIEHLKNSTEQAQNTFSVWSNPELGLGQKALASFGSGIGALGELYQAGTVGSTKEEDKGLFDYAADASSFLLRLTGQTVGTVLGGLQTVAEFTEQTLFGLPQGLQEVAGMGWDIPDIPVDLPLNADVWFPNFLEGVVDFIAMPVYAVGAAIAPGTFAEKLDTVAAHFQAGRIAYSSMVNPMIQEDYMRRWRAGENANLLAMEMGDPVAELVGELIFDPLNHIGRFTKALRSTNRITDKKSLFTVIEGGETGALAKAVDTGEAVDDITGARNIANVVDELLVRGTNVAQRQADFARSEGLLALTQDAKQAAMTELTGDLSQIIFANAKTANEATHMDRALDTLEGLMKVMSGDREQVALGYAALKNSDTPIEVLLSKAAGDLGHILLGTFSDGGKINVAGFAEQLKSAVKVGDDLADLLKEGGDVEKFLNELNDVEKAAKYRALLKEGKEFADVEGFRRYVQVSEAYGFLNQRTGKTISKMIPSIAERIAAGEKVKASTRVFGAFEAWKSSKGVRFIDNFFANVYMGLSPGYVARNLMVDRLTIFVDLGTAGRSRSRLGRMLDFDFMKSQTIERLGGFKPIAMEQGIGQVGVEAIRRAAPGLKKAADIEKQSSIAIMYHLVEDTMQKMVSFGEGGTIDLQKVIAAGANEDIVKAIPRLLDANNYDAAKTIEQLAQSLADGRLDVFSSLSWIPDSHVKNLKEYKLWENLKDIGQAATKEDAQKILDEARSVWNELADASRLDTPADLKNAEGIASMAEPGVFGDDMMLARHAQRSANKLATSELKSVIEDTMKLADQAGIQYDRKILETLGEASFLENKLTQAANNFPANMALIDDDPFKMWKALGVPGTAPSSPNAARGIVRDWYAMNFWSEQAKLGTAHRLSAWVEGEKWIREMRDTLKLADDRMFGRVFDLMAEAQKLDGTVRFEGKLVDVGVQGARHIDDLRKLGALNDVKLVEGDVHALNIAKRYAKGAGVALPDNFKNIGQLEFDDWAKILEYRATQKEGAIFTALDSVSEGAKPLSDVDALKGVNAPHLNTEALPAGPHAFAAANKPIDTILREIEQGIELNWGRTQEVISNPALDDALKVFAKDLEEKVAQARLIASQVATEGRHFALHNYGKRYNFDTVASIIYPFHFWQSRTYTNWAKRLATNPGVIAGYAKYKEALAQIHANAPEWWRYNVNSAELLGIPQDNPIFLNLEATLNPLYGLTGVDFNDRYKRINGFTSFLDDLSKFGPSMWTPISLAVALSLKQQGEDEAASRWGGRLIPQTKVLDSILSILEHGTETPFGTIGGGPSSIKPGDGGFRFDSLDPALAYFSGGIDPYERRRVGYALAMMVDEGIVTEDQATDAAQKQGGEVWDAALERAVNQRALGQVFSSIWGVGFKARNRLDLEVEKFDQERFALMNNRHNMSPDEYRQQWSVLKQRFPFADLVMMSRKAGYERDAAFVYDVLGRLPPGGKGATYEAAGLNPKQVSEFYDSKGDALETWSAKERESFMDAILNMSAVLASPDEATRLEWDQAKSSYSQYNNMIETMYGKDIQDKINMYFALREQSFDDADAFMDFYPEVGKALDFKSSAITADPTSPFATYYGSLSNIEGFYKGYMYQEIDQKLPEDIWDTLKTYWDMPARSSARRAYRRQHPEIGQYYDIKDKWSDYINRKVIEVGSKFPQERDVALRRDTSLSFSQEAFAKSLLSRDSLDDVSPDEWREMVGSDYSAVTNWLYGKVQIPWETRNRLEVIADELDISYDRLLQLIGISLQ